MFDELEEQTEFAPSWKPQAGEAVIGEVRRYRKAHNFYGNVVDICEILQDDGQRLAIWINSTVLLGKFRDLQPRIGERIAVKYFGKHPEKNYKRFALSVSRDEDVSSHEFEVPTGEPPSRDNEPRQDGVPPPPLAAQEDLGITDDDVPF